MKTLLLAILFDLLNPESGSGVAVNAVLKRKRKRYA
jgi:hypothetical protein